MPATTKTFEPMYLYRYRSIANKEKLQREMASIQGSTLWCSHFEKLNDPMEGSYSSSINLANHGRFQFVEARIYDEKSAFGICSFSETHDNGPMWAHYADQFSGICIAYNFEALRAALDEQCSFVRVAYEESPCVVTQPRLSDGEVAQRILSSKSHRWLYEREWRLFSPSPGTVPLIRRCISRVFLGKRMSRPNRVQLLDILAREHIEAREMELSGYEMKFATLRNGDYIVRPTLEDEID